MSLTVLLGDSYDSSSRGGEVRGAQGLGGHRHLLPQGHPLPQHQGSEYGTGWSTLYFIGISYITQANIMTPGELPRKASSYTTGPEARKKILQINKKCIFHIKFFLFVAFFAKRLTI